jgi:hypothetical protein
MDKTLLDEVIRTDYGQFDLVWAEPGGFDGDFDRLFQGQVNGLVGAADPNGVYINLARRSGGSPVRLVLRDGPPETDESFQDIVEVSVEVPRDAVVQWMSWAAETSGTLDLPAGSYRLRVSARDRDEGAAGEFSDGLVEAYLLELWPATPEPDAIIRAGTSDAEYWHREVGGRR